jgi:chitinase
MSATNNFSKVLGEGSFGLVYYGKLPNGQEVAVKRLSTTSHQGAKEFFTEVCLYIHISLKLPKLVQF